MLRISCDEMTLRSMEVSKGVGEYVRSLTVGSLDIIREKMYGHLASCLKKLVV